MRRPDRSLRGVLIGTDAVAVGLAWALALTVLAVQVGGVGDRGWRPLWIALAILVTVAVLAREQLYLTRVRVIRAVEVQRAGHGVLIAAALLGAADAAIAGPVTWQVFAVATVGSWAAVMGGRALVQAWLGAPRTLDGGRRALLVAGDVHVDRQVTDAVTARSGLGISILGLVSPHRPSHPLAVPWVGTLRDLPVVASLTAADAVILAGDTFADDRDRQRIVRDLRSLDVHVHVVTRALDGTLRIRLVPLPQRSDALDGVPGLTIAQHATKRIFDLIAGSVLALAALPVLGIVAGLIRFFAPGPVVVRDVRHGPSGEVLVTPRLQTRNLPETRIAQWVGQTCRRLCIDELPQIVSVLAGTMTLVGPRPVWRRGVVRPLDVHAGLIGLRHVDGPCGGSRRTDEFYVENWSVGLDMSIIATSVGHVVCRAVGDVVRGGAHGAATV